MAKIIVVDDHREICDSLQQRLTLDGHDVKTALAGAEAIDLGHLFEPDILITDWDLGSEYDGIEVAEGVKAARSEIKSILITSHRIPEKLTETAFAAKLLKPFTIEQLSESVTKVLASPN